MSESYSEKIGHAFSLAAIILTTATIFGVGWFAGLNLIDLRETSLNNPLYDDANVSLIFMSIAYAMLILAHLLMFVSNARDRGAAFAVVLYLLAGILLIVAGAYFDNLDIVKDSGMVSEGGVFAIATGGAVVGYIFFYAVIRMCETKKNNNMENGYGSGAPATNSRFAI